MNDEIKNNFQQTAATLAEALPYIQRYEGSTIVIKLGGHAMTSKSSMDNFARDIVLIKQCGVNPVIVHGGGPMINKVLSDLKIESTFTEGKRVTDSKTMEVVEMVLSGSINKSIVNAINNQGGKGVGLSGKDANMIECVQDNPKLGFVGKIQKINTDLVQNFLASDFIPVIAPIGFGNNGDTYNINGDTAAGAMASSLLADRLLLLTDVIGVKDADENLINQLTVEEARELIDSGIINAGMVPKVNTSIKAIEDGVIASVIIDGRVDHACLLELFTSHGIGTLFKKTFR
ncbi:acetylglutamate kinase [Paracoccaceae bacterium]|nr:acetylglutamate kinase [Paracoccaceae bacterium]